MRWLPRPPALTIAIGGLAMAGAAISGYLTVVHAAGAPLICGGQGSCATVQSSESATWTSQHCQVGTDDAVAA